MNLPNMVRRVIVHLLMRCSVCHNPKHFHPKDHTFQLDEAIPKWKGWHCFRRSLASNLYALGVKPKVIQAILRIATSLPLSATTWKRRKLNLGMRLIS